MDAAVASVASGAAVFLEEPDRVIDDDPDSVRVPRREWEALLLRLERASRSAPRSRTKPAWDESVAARPVVPVPEPAPAVEPPRRASAAVGLDPRALRLEIALMELESLAESALVTRDRLGSGEFQRLIDASADELDRLAVRLDRPAGADETPLALLVRLLADSSRRPDLALPPKYAEELRGRSARLARSLKAAASAVAPPSARAPAPVPKRPARALGTPADEVESLLRVLEDRRESSHGDGEDDAPPSDDA